MSQLPFSLVALEKAFSINKQIIYSFIWKKEKFSECLFGISRQSKFVKFCMREIQVGFCLFIIFEMSCVLFYIPIQYKCAAWQKTLYLNLDFSLKILSAAGMKYEWMIAYEGKTVKGTQLSRFLGEFECALLSQIAVCFTCCDLEQFDLLQMRQNTLKCHASGCTVIVFSVSL